MNQRCSRGPNRPCNCGVRGNPRCGKPCAVRLALGCAVAAAECHAGCVAGILNAVAGGGSDWFSCVARGLDKLEAGITTVIVQVPLAAAIAPVARLTELEPAAAVTVRPFRDPDPFRPLRRS